MLELGKGFQLNVGSEDLSLKAIAFLLTWYCTTGRCFVLFYLKIGKLTQQDIGQMQMYVNYYDRKLQLPEENPTIGIILCKEENRTVVEFTLPEDNKQIFSKEYKAVLQSKEALKIQLE